MAGGEVLAELKTSGVAPESRATFWAKGYASRFASVCVDPTNHKDFQAELRVRSLGPVTLAWVHSMPSVVTRTKEQASQATEKAFGFVIQLQGTGSVAHCGRRTALAPGDIVLNDVTQPMRCSFGEPMQGVTVRVSEPALRTRIPFADDMLGVCLSAQAPLASTAVNMTRSLVMADDQLPGDYSTAVATSLLDILAMAYSSAYGKVGCDGSIIGARYAVVVDFIEARLHDPSLTPAIVSSALKIAPRHLRRLMARYGETVSRYILRRRLEESSKQLTSPLCRERAITDIAFSLGFNSTSHFTRVFKSKYGLAPTDYRVVHAKHYVQLTS